MREKTLLPWALRDLTTCFNQCGFRLEGEEELDSNPIHENNKSGDRKIPNHTKESIQSSAKTRKHPPPQQERSFPDEDFIVFQFTKDGSINVVNNNNNAKKDTNKSSSRNIRTKIIFMEHGQKVYKSNHVKAKKDKGDSLIPDEANTEMCRGEENVKCDKKPGTCENVGEKQGETSQSDESSTSFEFPELNWEEIGSPKQMHTPDPHKQLTQHTMFSHSCRF